MQGIIDFFYSLWLSFVDWGEDMLLRALDVFMSVGIIILDGVAYLFQAIDVTQYISALPPNVVNVLQLCGFGEAMGVIITAGTIRLTLQLIPFVRLGS
jgi:hypothetical protein